MPVTANNRERGEQINNSVFENGRRQSQKPLHGIQNNEKRLSKPKCHSLTFVLAVDFVRKLWPGKKIHLNW